MHTVDKTILLEGAVYIGDNGRMMCCRCAGTSASYTGRDLSGQRVDRVSVADVRAWPAKLGTLACECGRVKLAPIAGLNGWPLKA